MSYDFLSILKNSSYGYEKEEKSFDYSHSLVANVYRHGKDKVVKFMVYSVIFTTYNSYGF